MSDLKIKAILEIPFELEVIQLICTLEDYPKLFSNKEQIPFMSTNTWSLHSYRWEDIKINPIKINYENKVNLANWFFTYINNSICRDGYVGYKKLTTLKIFDSKNQIFQIWQLHGSNIKNLNLTLKTETEKKYEKLILNNKLIKTIFIEKNRNESDDSMYDITIGFDRAILYLK